MADAGERAISCHRNFSLIGPLERKPQWRPELKFDDRTVATRLWRVRDNGLQGRGYNKMHDSREERILLRAGPIRGRAGD
jgi:hypothetical protein